MAFYRETSRVDHLLSFLYADVLSQGSNYMLLVEKRSEVFMPSTGVTISKLSLNGYLMVEDWRSVAFYFEQLARTKRIPKRNWKTCPT